MMMMMNTTTSRHCQNHHRYLIQNNYIGKKDYTSDLVSKQRKEDGKKTAFTFYPFQYTQARSTKQQQKQQQKQHCTTKNERKNHRRNLQKNMQTHERRSRTYHSLHGAIHPPHL
mmetsp:Transcript_10402/g.15421  ORF Transcript_10402/g.15421 Transcript_10402/m.15421 type:complete len:114 (-) Transcript_10402:854-1195(-)